MKVTRNYLKHVNKGWLQHLLINNFHKAIVSTIKQAKVKSILDVGCGEGFTLSKISHELSNIKLKGADISDVAVGIANKLFPYLKIQKGNIYKLKYGNRR